MLISYNVISSISSYTIKLKNGNEMIVTNLTFTNRFEKAKLLGAKKDKGDMKAVNFFPSLSVEQGANNTIYIGHKLSKNNIKLRKTLIDLQRENKINAKRFWTNRFQIQLTPSGKWIDVATPIDLNFALMNAFDHQPMESS